MNLIISLAIVFATLLGPVLAVLITRRIDSDRQLRGRRMEVFRTLMGTRRTPLSPDRVKALNLVELDFYGLPAVLEAYSALMSHLNTRGSGGELWQDKHRSLMTRLLSEMARVLGYRLQQLDVLEGGYYPQRFADIETEAQEVRQALIQVLSGRRPLLVAQTAPTPPQPFPPPPRPVVG